MSDKPKQRSLEGDRILLNAIPTIIQPIALLANTMTSKQQEVRKDGYLPPS
jgi:hypothetical protein